ncbi:glycosyltransferase [Luteimonas sp. RD2P54]|uniref:Glycosyltransferase n=1 Tax=Luteimonas endophytica TaxID=3042023 RepID=A0ABT6JCB0_9GAMM|nr:glycosyltransferase [Luteimonas endophytica]MDH5824472.1 glycosyltransferase [Luteimonas endophytica]
MQILILTLGSHGDVQPYVALGRGLQAAGHAVSLCTSAHFAGFVAEHGLDYRHMDNGFVELMASLEGRAALEGMGSFFGALKTMATLVPKVGPLQVRVQQDAWRAAQDLRPELILFHPKMAGAVDIADALGATAIMAPLFPQYVPTAEFPAVGLPALPLGARYNRASYRLVHAIGNRVGRGPLRTWRRDNGLGPRPPALGLFTDARGRPIPVLHGYSPTLSPPPPDWPEHAKVAGAWTLPHAAGWAPPPALAAFLAAGPPPVYVGFGSMAGRNPARVAAIVLEALQRSGRRGLLASGWGGLAAHDLPKDVLAIGHVPHDWLFPRVAAVVHHGGAGSTHAGLHAGRPTVVCPFFGDQPFWGRRVQALGAGPAPIPQRRLSAERLADAIGAATGDAGISAAAAATGGQLRAEHGVEQAVAWIEDWMAMR